MMAALTIFVAFLVQSQILPMLGLKLDLLLLTTLYYGFLYGWKKGCGVGLLAGLVQDVFSLGLLGLTPVGLVTCGLFAGFAKRMLLLRYWIVRVGLVFVLTMLNLLIYLGVTRIFSQTWLYTSFINNWLIVSLSNTITAGIIFWLVDRYG